jgi:hypothetical protein
MGYSGNLYAQATEVITSQGDLRRGDSSGNPERLAIGANTYVLSSNGTTESWTAPATPTNVQYSVAAMSGVDFDFDSTNAIQTLSISGNTTFTGSNYAAGKSITLFITTDGSLRTLAFPAGWIFEGAKPTDQAASKVGVLTLLCTSTSEASVRCAYAVEA